MLISIIVVLIVIGLFVYGATKRAINAVSPVDSFESESLSAGSSATCAASSGNSLNEAAPAGGAREAAPLKVIKTWTRRDCSLAPWLITDKLGHFKEEGGQIVVTGEIQPPQQIPSILTGDNDVAALHPNAAAVGINEGAPLKGVSRCEIEPSADLDPAFWAHVVVYTSGKVPQCQIFCRS